MARQSFVSLFSFSCGALEGYQCEGQKAKEASKGAGRCVYTNKRGSNLFSLLYLSLFALFISYSRLNEAVLG